MSLAGRLRRSLVLNDAVYVCRACCSLTRFITQNHVPRRQGLATLPVLNTLNSSLSGRDSIPLHRAGGRLRHDRNEEIAGQRNYATGNSPRKSRRRRLKSSKEKANKEDVSESQLRTRKKKNAREKADEATKDSAGMGAKVKSQPKKEAEGSSFKKSKGSKVVPRKVRSASTQRSASTEPQDVPLWQVMQMAANGATTRRDAEETGGRSSSKSSGVTSDSSADSLFTIKPSELKINPIDITQPPVPALQHGLDRVLFNEGIYQLQDPHSRVYNFDPYLQKIMPVIDFNFNALKEYKTSSRDEALSSLAKSEGKKYIGSTSSMTGTLSHFHYLLSNMRNVNLDMLSRGFRDQLATFTKINQAPNAIFLRWKDGTYAIDADKEYDGANVLMMLGKSMEKLLTLPRADFERYRKGHPVGVSQEEKNEAEAFQYTTMGDFLMRSQLDAHDPRLPGTGMFDLKTRAVVSIRMETEHFQPMTGYQIHTLQGRFESYEREYYDMIRSTMLKYMLQARMGRMDGIFVAYHNVERIFGFQYLPIRELDRALHGQANRCLGDQEFRASLYLLNKALDSATSKYPEQSLRLHFETGEENLDGSPSTVMWIYAEPMSEAEVDEIQATAKGKIAAFERTAMGIEAEEAEVSASSTSTASSVADDGLNTTNTSNSENAEAISEEVMGKAKLGAVEHRQSSASGTDTKFIQALSAAQKEMKPLFVASLIIKSRVNGAEVDRPKGLMSDDEWEVEYLLQEWEADDALWARYEAMKARRRDVLVSEVDEDEDLSNRATVKKSDSYIRFLQQISEQGREFRNRIDELEKDRAQVVVGEPVPRRPEELETLVPAADEERPNASNNRIGATAPDVDGYMSWLYAPDAR